LNLEEERKLCSHNKVR